MKKLTLFLTAAVSLFLFSCGTKPADSVAENKEAVPAESQPADTVKDEKQIAVVYFSATGHTRMAAGQIAELCGADLFEIVPAEPYAEEDLNYHDESTRATLEQKDPAARPAIASGPFDLSEYQVLVLGYPIWWGQAPRIMNTFVEQYDFGDQLIIPFCTSASSPIADSAEYLQELSKGGRWQAGTRFSAAVTMEELQAWLETVMP
ncbi:MAG: flavodoxin [Solobacterium sp.]|nr:flavodoxin [Solobacterium sp.]